MKIVDNVIGRWISRRLHKAQPATQAQANRQPKELDTRTLRQVSGGDGGSSHSPTKGW